MSQENGILRKAKLALGAVALMGTLAVSSRSDAGLKGTNSVVSINTSSRTATGSLGLARNSSNSTEYIGCGMDSPGNAFCTARDSGGTTVSCSTTSSSFREVLKSMNGDSFVSFSWDSAGACTRVYVDNYSFWPLKAP